MHNKDLISMEFDTEDAAREWVASCNLELVRLQVNSRGSGGCIIWVKSAPCKED